MKHELYRTKLGKMIVGDSIELYSSYLKKNYQNKFNLIITSPPFPLNNKKMYGNLRGETYLKWFTDLAPIFSDLLTEDGSLVIEIGNAWEPKRPVQSLLHLRSLISLVEHKKAGLRLIQEFIAYNPAKLPSPAQWVTVNRIRTVDSYTHVWWIAKSDFPKADNTKALRSYSKSMKRLLKEKKYNSGKRPSEHNISVKGFAKNNGGSIAHNFFELDPLDNDREVRLPHNVLSFANTSSNDNFLRVCRERGITPHPARMNGGLVNFFIEFLTEENDLIFDPFAGSNTTGYCAEKLNRRWLSIEANKEYATSSLIRFDPPTKSVSKEKKA
jgi:site-specific DNA-methyltransferase (cytosine-N4-specific)